MTQVQVILRVHLLKLGTVKQKKDLRWKKQDHSNRSKPRLSCLDAEKEPTVTEVTYARLRVLRIKGTEVKRYKMPLPAASLVPSLLGSFRA